jgi:hypothetical protein
MARKGNSDLFSYLRSQGLRKSVARALSDLESGGRDARGNAEKLGRRVIADLRAAADSIEKRLDIGGAVKKAAGTRKRAATKRSTAAKKGAAKKGAAKKGAAKKGTAKRARKATKSTASRASGTARKTTSSARKTTARKSTARKTTARKRTTKRSS